MILQTKHEKWSISPFDVAHWPRGGKPAACRSLLISSLWSKKLFRKSFHIPGSCSEPSPVVMWANSQVSGCGVLTVTLAALHSVISYTKHHRGLKHECCEKSTNQIFWIVLTNNPTYQVFPHELSLERGPFLKLAYTLPKRLRRNEW